MKKQIFLGFLSSLMIFSACKSYNTSTTYDVVISSGRYNSIINGNETGEFTGDHSRADFDELQIDYANLPVPEFTVGEHTFKDPMMHRINNQDFSRSAISAEYSTSDLTPTHRDARVGDTQNFWIIRDTNNSPYIFDNKSATLKKSGKKCNVWLVEDTLVEDYVLATLQETFDTIYDYETKLCGPSYLESYGYSNCIKFTEEDKINILIYDIDNDENNGNVLGYFYGVDLYAFDNSDYKSNKCEVFYVDSVFLNNDNYRNLIYSTLAHEFNHMLNNLNKTCKNKVEYSSWYTEMLSMLTEDVLQSVIGVNDAASPKNRISDFNSGTNYGFINSWNDNKLVYSAYANTYIFGAYLIRNFGGIDLLHELMQNEYGDEMAIDEALAKIGRKETFETILSRFGEIYANMDNINPDVCSVNKTVTGKLDDFEYSGTKINLRKNYYGAGYTFTDPKILSADDYDFVLYPTGFIVKQVISNKNWKLNNIKNQNENLQYKLYTLDY